MKLTISPLTPDLWSALEDLFGKRGACNGCWCMYWRLGPEYFRRPHEENRRALRRIVRQGPPPGLLAFDGELAVGWCQLTPRADLDWLNRKPTLWQAQGHARAGVTAGRFSPLQAGGKHFRPTRYDLADTLPPKEKTSRPSIL
jgi:hypothetical protein